MAAKRKSKTFGKFYISLFSILLCLMICFEAVTVEYFSEQLYHYDVRKDLSVYFTNADEVIMAIRKCLQRHDWHIIVSFNSHSDNMKDIDDIIRELMDYAVAETDNPTEGDYIRLLLISIFPLEPNNSQLLYNTGTGRESFRKDFRNFR